MAEQDKQTAAQTEEQKNAALVDELSLNTKAPAPTMQTGETQAGEKHTEEKQTAKGGMPAYPQELVDAQIARQQAVLDGMRKPQTEEQRLREERRHNARKMVASIGEAMGAIANMAGTANYAPYVDPGPKMSDKMQERFEKAKAERKAKDDAYYALADKIYNLKMGDYATKVNNWLSREKLKKDNEADEYAKKEREHKMSMWGDEKRRAAALADSAEHKAIFDMARADMAPELIAAQIHKAYRVTRGGGGGKYYGSIAGTAYATKADFYSALGRIYEEYGLDPNEIVETTKTSNGQTTTTKTEKRKSSGAMVAEAENAINGGNANTNTKTGPTGKPIYGSKKKGW